MNKQIKQAVINKLRELVPELQELSFGCVIKVPVVGSMEKGKIISSTSFGVSTTGFVNTTSFGVMSVEEIKQSKEIKIIGHPIHLRHVLMAIRKQTDDCYFVDTEGGFWIDTVRCGVYWNLFKPLPEQDDEVFELLSKVLGVK